jgi:hypothetical protein
VKDDFELTKKVGIVYAVPSFVAIILFVGLKDIGVPLALSGVSCFVLWIYWVFNAQGRTKISEPLSEQQVLERNAGIPTPGSTVGIFAGCSLFAVLFVGPIFVTQWVLQSGFLSESQSNELSGILPILFIAYVFVLAPVLWFDLHFIARRHFRH